MCVTEICQSCTNISNYTTYFIGGWCQHKTLLPQMRNILLEITAILLVFNQFEIIHIF